MNKVPHMTKCHFSYIAETIRAMHVVTDGADMRRLRNVAERFADALDNTNQGFRRESFLNACGISESEIWAFDAGFSHAASVAHANVPTVGETVTTESDGDVFVAIANVRDVHVRLSMDAESMARQFSPWEFVAKALNDLPDEIRDAAWQAYEYGVEARIMDDVDRFDIEEYLPADADLVPARGDLV